VPCVYQLCWTVCPRIEGVLDKRAIFTRIINFVFPAKLEPMHVESRKDRD